MRANRVISKSKVQKSKVFVSSLGHLYTNDRLKMTNEDGSVNIIKVHIKIKGVNEFNFCGHFYEMN